MGSASDTGRVNSDEHELAALTGRMTELAASALSGNCQAAIVNLKTGRHDHAMTGADEYEGLNVLARLTAALLTMEAWLRVHRLADAAVADVLEHMWQWPTVKPDTFRPWFDFHSDELQAAEAEEPLPRRIALACQERGASAEDLAALLANIVNIVYDSLFSALDLDLSLARLRNIEVVAARSGVRLPAAQRFASLKAEDMHGWGIPVSAMQVADWRGEPSGRA